MPQDPQSLDNRSKILRLITGIVVICVNCLPLLPLAAESIGWHPSQDIRQRVQVFIEKNALAADKDNTSYQIGALDRRLRLRRCEHPLEITTSATVLKIGRNVVNVRCNAPVSWKVNIPVQIERYREVVITRENIHRGQRLQASQFTLKKMPVSRLRGNELTSINLAVDSRAMRSLRAGQTVAEKALCLICKGDKVKVTVDYGRLSIEAEVEAAENGLIDDYIQVRNIQTGQLFRAQIISGNQLIIRRTQPASVAIAR